MRANIPISKIRIRDKLAMNVSENASQPGSLTTIYASGKQF
jgi:hypothetical protein